MVAEFLSEHSKYPHFRSRYELLHSNYRRVTLFKRDGSQRGSRIRFIGLMPRRSVACAEGYFSGIALRVRSLQAEEREDAVDGIFHDHLHFCIGDTRIFGRPGAARAKLSRMQSLNWAVADSKRHDGLGLPCEFAIFGICGHFRLPAIG